MKNLVMTKHNGNAGKKGYRFLASLLAVVLMLGCMMVPDTQAKASSLSLGVSTSSVKIGDTVTVSITVPAGVSATVNVTYPTGVFSFSSASDTASANGGTVSMTIGSYGSTNTRTTGTMKFKAKAAGSATFSASAPIAGNQEGDRVTVSGASASVRVKNESNDSDSGSSNADNSNNGSNNGNDNAGNGDDNTKKSADNSLSSLTLSAGKLSPAFQYNVTNYTAEVDNDVTSVVVSAKPSNANATVESVKGGEKLAVGVNTIQIVVKAENGVTATYTIKVTRKEAGAADEPDEPDEDEDDTDEPQEQCYEIGGVKMYPSEDGDETQIPEGFALSEITLWENAYPYWVNNAIGTDVGLIYLVDGNKENGAWYRISETSPYEAYPFVCLKSEFGYIIAVPEKMTEAAPAGYTAETINIEGKGIVDAYVKEGDEDNVLLYAVNQDGAYGLYRYDVQDRTYMRYNDPASAEEDTQVTEPTTQPDNAGISDLESQNRLIFYAFIVVVAILLIVIVILVVKRRHDDDDDDDDADDVWDDDENDAEGVEGESDQSDEHGGIHKRYDRSAFLTGDAEIADEADSDEDSIEDPVEDSLIEGTDAKSYEVEAVEGEVSGDRVLDAEEADDEVSGDETLADSVSDEEIDESADENAAVENTQAAPVSTSTLDLEAVLAQAVSETMNDNADEDTKESETADQELVVEKEEEKPKKKKARRGLFGRRKKKDEDEDDDLEFLDL